MARKPPVIIKPKKPIAVIGIDQRTISGIVDPKAKIRKLGSGSKSKPEKLDPPISALEAKHRGISVKRLLLTGMYSTKELLDVYGYRRVDFALQELRELLKRRERI